MLTDFMVMELKRDGSVKGWGATQFAVVPRIREVITKDVAGVDHAFEVLMVMHPSQPVSLGGPGEPAYSGGDLWVIDRGNAHKWIDDHLKTRR